MLTLFLFLGIVYGSFMVMLRLVWGKSKQVDRMQVIDSHVSLLIPFRNEMDNLRLLFDSIERLTIKPMEVIWIDDHSDDGSMVMLADMIKEGKSTYQHILLSADVEGKKAALEKGVKMATGDLIFTTDADCEVPSSWIKSMLIGFIDPKVMLVAGPVMNKPKAGYFDAFQQLDWSSIILVSYTAIQMKSPLMCSGANLAYRKSAFLEVLGYEGNRSLMSGDDEFLLKKIAKRFGSQSIVYQRSNSSLVVTHSHEDWDSMLAQRVRWASKWRGHDFIHGLFSLLPFTFQLYWMATVILPFLYGFYGLFSWVFLWILKVVLEGKMLGNVCSYYDIRLSWKYRLLTSLIHPFYVMIVGIKSIRGRYKWKGRVSF
ncbi:glycosyltransferase [Belliella kenyensis]|uniref:Glycosyltransferase n=1 Tax=Belliella kenyensis TaxID=1472724 RepID=A0ABV8ELH2_9BACT|nr:glycosyltransferase [Belliella kenyensis]MCH7400727.1 glycosyltransferase [Belliella kenyensis]MDN3601986.1 glycosyltransferase [Belliella kenyensis]